MKNRDALEQPKEALDKIQNLLRRSISEVAMRIAKKGRHVGRRTAQFIITLYIGNRLHTQVA